MLFQNIFVIKFKIVAQLSHKLLYTSVTIKDAEEESSSHVVFLHHIIFNYWYLCTKEKNENLKHACLHTLGFKSSVFEYLIFSAVHQGLSYQLCVVFSLMNVLQTMF